MNTTEPFGYTICCMRYVLSTLVALAWALWFGGVAGLFVAVPAVFRATDRATAGQIGSAIFNAFGRYQLAVAAVALIAAAALRLTTPGRARTGLFVLLGTAAVGASVFTGVITPRVDALRAVGRTQTPEFRTLHRASELVVAGQMLALLGAGCVLPAALRRAEAVAPASGDPGREPAASAATPEPARQA
jgi:hypothetical protein